MKKKNTGLALMIAVLVLMAAAFVVYLVTRPEQETAPSMPSVSEPQDEPKTEEGSGSASTGIPDMRSSDDPLVVGERMDLDSLSPTILTDDEVLQEVSSILEGLRTLDADAVEKISPLTMTGEYNATHFMLAAALENTDLGVAFRKLGEASRFEILDITASGVNTNTYTVRVKCSTPYLAHDVQEYLAGTQGLPVEQDFALFAGSGAARWISEQTVTGYNMTTDIVHFSILVVDDELMFFHPISETFGSRIPQYAFLWGGFIFQGTEGGDLLLENHLGSLTLMDQETLAGITRGAEVNQYLQTGLDLLKRSDFEGMRTLQIGDLSYAGSWFMTRTLPVYQQAMEQIDGFAEELDQRLTSLEYEISVYTDGSGATKQSVVAVQLAISDPQTQGIVRAAFYHNINIQSEKGISALETELVSSFLTEIMETAIGGNHTQLQAKLQYRQPA